MAIVFDAGAEATDTDASSLTFAHTVTEGGSGKILVVACGGEEATTDVVTGVTYGGDTLLALDGTSDTLVGSCYLGKLWYTTTPKSGSNNVVASLASGNLSHFWAISASFTGVSASTPFGTPVYDTTESSDVDSDHTQSVDVTSAATELVIDAICAHGSGDAGLVAGANQTEVGDPVVDDGANPRSHGGMSYETGAATTTMSWTQEQFVQDWVQFAVALKPASSGRSRAVHYFYDVNDPLLRILDDQGRPVPAWEIKPDRWMKVTGIFLPSASKPDSFIEDPELAYIESVTFLPNGNLQIRTSRAEFAEVILARAAGQTTL